MSVGNFFASQEIGFHPLGSFVAEMVAGLLTEAIICREYLRYSDATERVGKRF
jgi:hypothetical protein